VRLLLLVRGGIGSWVGGIFSRLVERVPGTNCGGAGFHPPAPRD